MSTFGPEFYNFIKKLEDNGDKLSHSTMYEEPPALEFEFTNTTCYICNGYYGPSFGEPVCVTCHAFLFPDFPSYFPHPYFLSEKTDDGDSGNDEPSDLNYSSDRRVNRTCQMPAWWYYRNSLDSETSPEDEASRASNSGPGASSSNGGGAPRGQQPLGPAPAGPGPGCSRPFYPITSELPPFYVLPEYPQPVYSGSAPETYAGPESDSWEFGGPGSSGTGSGGLGSVGLGSSGLGFGGSGSGGQGSGGPGPGGLGSGGSGPGSIRSGGPGSGGPGSRGLGYGDPLVGDLASGGPSIGGSRQGGMGIGGPGPGYPGSGDLGPGSPDSSDPGSGDTGSGGPRIDAPGEPEISGSGPSRQGDDYPGSGDPGSGSLESVGPETRDTVVTYTGSVGPSAEGLEPSGDLESAGPGCGDVGGIEDRAGDGLPPQPPSLAGSLHALSTPRLPDNVSPGLVEQLPSEVLLCIFSYLDDLSLCATSCVCARWWRLVRARVPPPRWAGFAARRWPLYRPVLSNIDWHKKYQALVESCFCRNCLVQMSLHAQPVGDENAWRRNRLRIELKMMRNDPPEGIAATPLDAKCCHWQASVTGPVGSPYEGGVFYLYIQVPFSYPMSPPVVRFLTRILHPNVSRHGDVGIDSVHHNWSLALTISKVLISIQSLLTDPYTTVCMEPELGEMYVRDRVRFETLARSWTWRYAMHDLLL